MEIPVIEVASLQDLDKVGEWPYYFVKKGDCYLIRRQVIVPSTVAEKSTNHSTIAQAWKKDDAKTLVLALNKTWYDSQIIWSPV